MAQQLRLKPQRPGTPCLSSEEVLRVLASIPITAVLFGDGIWTLVTKDQAYQLDQCCFGALDGGPGSAADLSTLLQLDDEEEVWQPVSLSVQEAFFLHHVLDSLTLLAAATETDTQDQQTLQPMSTEEMLHKFQSLCPQFNVLYVAYRHFRSKGWLTRSGLTFGVDYVLYHTHPSAAHSQFGVLVVSALEKEFNWHDLQCAQRLLWTVGKKLLLLTVEPPNTVRPLSDVDKLMEYRVEERVLDRWIPNTTR